MTHTEIGGVIHRYDDYVARKVGQHNYVGQHI